MTAQQRAPELVECTNCSDETGLVVGVASAVLAAVALVVSFWSLYATALRRPKVELEHLAHEGQLAWSGWSGELPAPRGASLELWIVLANTGAGATFVATLEVTDSLTCHGQDAGVFTRLERSSPHLRGEGGKTIEQPPLVFERGEVEHYRLGALLLLRNDLASGEDVARSLHGLESVSVTVEWSYRRAKSLRPWQRETAHVSAQLRLDASHLRSSALAVAPHKVVHPGLLGGWGC
jgi:hypothetical protein